MSIKHTPEPWKAHKNLIQGADGRWIAELEDMDWDVDVSNARRAVACVNAMAGLDPEAVRELVEAVEKYTEDLLSACPDTTDSFNQMSDALAKVRQK